MYKNKTLNEYINNEKEDTKISMLVNRDIEKEMLRRYNAIMNK